LSYLIDVYKGQIKPERNLINYAVSISYFPIIVSGPIHRPRIFLDQLRKKNDFSYDLAVEGLRQILTGLFYKVLIADNIAKYSVKAFTSENLSDGFSLLTGSVYFSFQLYYDFNGYSEMAIGISKLLGFRIDRNFKYPYLSRTISDFWKRWHISLTQWFRDYIFLPFSYILSRKIKPDSFLDKDIIIYSVGIFITWALTGFWHGAGWNFIVWGMIHAVLLIINKSFFKRKKSILKSIKLKKDNVFLILYESMLTFFLVNISWIFFRSQSAYAGFKMIEGIMDLTTWHVSGIDIRPLLLILFVQIIEFLQRNKEFLFDIPTMNKYLRWIVYLVITTVILYYSGHDVDFIYMGF